MWHSGRNDHKDGERHHKLLYFIKRRMDKLKKETTSPRRARGGAQNTSIWPSQGMCGLRDGLPVLLGETRHLQGLTEWTRHSPWACGEKKRPPVRQKKEGRKKEKRDKENERQRTKRKHNKDNGRTSFECLFVMCGNSRRILFCKCFDRKTSTCSNVSNSLLKPINYYAATSFYRF